MVCADAKRQLRELPDRDVQHPRRLADLFVRNEVERCGAVEPLTFFGLGALRKRIRTIGLTERIYAQVVHTRSTPC